MTGYNNLLNQLREVYNELSGDYKQRRKHYENFLEERKTLVPFVSLVKNQKFSKISILEIGPGSGLDLKDMIQEEFQTTAMDISEKMIEVAREVAPETEYITHDFLTYDFKDIKYEGIFARGFIHLFPKDLAIENIKKIGSLLVPRGIAFIGTTKHEKPWEGWLSKEEYSKELMRYRKKWTEEELEQALIELGFDILYRGYHQEKKDKLWMFPIVQKP